MKPNNKIMIIHVTLFENIIIIIIITTYIIFYYFKLYNNKFIYIYYMLFITILNPFIFYQTNSIFLK